MNKLFTILVTFVITTTTWAQAPQKMSYQAVIRNSSDELITNSPVGMQFSIIQGSSSGTVVYTETQTPTTNENGLVSIEIGEGAGFSYINWANGPYFIKTETDPTGGTNYTITGTSQLLSVPYSLHAKTADSISGPITETDPIFMAHPASGIAATDITDWNTAFGWGNHALAGYLTSFTEADPIFAVHPASGITSTNIINWNTAFGWGNHALAGYLTSFTETDPIFAVHPASGITSTNIINWNTAFGWGNHAGLYRPISWVPSWTEVTGKPAFATVATSGSYNDLTDKPTGGNGININGTNQISLNITSQAAGDMMYFDGTNWVKVAAGTPGQLLGVNASGAPEWQNPQIPSSLKSAGINAPTMNSTGVIFNGVVNPNGLSTLVTFEYGTDLTYGNSATVAGSPFSGTTNTALSSALISSLTTGTTYHVRIVTQNIFGIFYGNDYSFTYLYYGASYAGGLVFSFDSNGEHGFVCAPSDQDSVAEYFEYFAYWPPLHTDGPDLFNSCKGTINGYNDWYAPSFSMLSMMYTNLKLQGLGSFANAPYWSTNVSNPIDAYVMNFTDGTTAFRARQINIARVRAVRHF